MNQTKIKVKEKKWLINFKENPENLHAVEKIASDLGVSLVLAKLLYQRGYTTSALAKSFLYMETEVLTSPFGIRDMEKAIERIATAVNSGEKITVYGDYDVDGVTAVCTLYLYLKSKGADIDYYIPNRAGDGYGVSNAAISQLKENGTSLIITVDTGITANEEVEFARECGVDFVITDHHECRQELPLACAVVNPHRSDCQSRFKDLAGVGVVFKVISAYEEKICGKSSREAALKIFSEYADLVAIGTIADVMPIKEENRLIVSYGLKMIEKSPRLGLQALMEASSGRSDAQRQSARKRQTKITSAYVGYTLAPRINAAGRIRSASVAVELFLANDYGKALSIAEGLCEANRERQAEENKIMKDAYRKIEESGFADMPVIVLDADNWHHGVIGIVSSRITEKYGKPSILVSFEGNMGNEASADDVGKGSGRSVKGLNLVDALCHCNDELIKFGGHELAAGLSVTRGNLDAFRKKINEYADNALGSEGVIPTVEADVEIDITEVNFELAEELRILEPYGVSNPVPNFVSRSVSIAEMTSVSDGKHTRFVFSSGKSLVSAMYFSASPSSLGLYVGDTVDVLFNIDINEWGGRKSVQLIIRDVKEANTQRSVYDSEQEKFAKVWGGDKFSPAENILPVREDFAYVYRLIIAALRSGVSELSIRDILHKISLSHEGCEIGYVKLKVIIKVMQELNIIGIEEVGEDLYRFRMYYKTSKAELEKSHLLKRLRSQMKI